jgi:hypothetical protein
MAFRHKVLAFFIPMLLALIVWGGRKSESVPVSSAPTTPNAAVATDIPRPPRFSNDPPGSAFVVSPPQALPDLSAPMPGGSTFRQNVQAQSAEADRPAPPTAAPRSTAAVSTAATTTPASSTSLFGDDRGDGWASTAGRRGAGAGDAVPTLVSGGDQPDAIIAINAAERAPAGTPYRPYARRERDQEQQLPEIFGQPFEARPPVAQVAAASGVGASSVSDGARAAGAPEQKVGGSASGRSSSRMAEFAPFGRLVKIELLNTIDSLAPGKVPLIGLVMDAVNWNGRTIIPVNTEVHGSVLTEPLLDIEGTGRLFAENTFTLVFPGNRGRANGREMLVRGMVLDRRETVLDGVGRPSAWGIADMAPGLIGDTISTVDKEELKLFAAAFLGEAAKSMGEILQERESVIGSLGQVTTQPIASTRNALTGALGAGVGGALDQVVERLQESVAKRGAYVRVRGGKTIYLYIQETLDPTRAAVGLNLPELNDRERLRLDEAKEAASRRRENAADADAPSLNP